MRIAKEIGGYGLVDVPKIRRAETASKGNDKLTLALYEKYGGLIVKKGVVVEKGTFWDFIQKVPADSKVKELPGVERVRALRATRSAK